MDETTAFILYLSVGFVLSSAITAYFGDGEDAVLRALVWFFAWPAAIVFCALLLWYALMIKVGEWARGFNERRKFLKKLV